MGVNEYVLALMAIVSGLAVTDMVGSLHGLLRRFRVVQWDFLPVSAAALVLLAVLYSWFFSWQGASWTGKPFWVFLIAIGQLIGIFLAAKAVLPDDDGTDNGISLLEHYRKQNRYVWLALSMTSMLTVVITVSSGARQGMAMEFFLNSTPFIIYTGILLSLVLIQKMWWHRIIVPALLIGLAVLWHGRVLTGTV